MIRNSCLRWLLYFFYVYLFIFFLFYDFLREKKKTSSFFFFFFSYLSQGLSYLGGRVNARGRVSQVRIFVSMLHYETPQGRHMYITVFFLSFFRIEIVVYFSRFAFACWVGVWRIFFVSLFVLLLLGYLIFFVLWQPANKFPIHITHF